MKKIILSIIVAAIFLAVSCGSSKKTGNDADAVENHDEDTVETGDADEIQTDEDAEETDEETSSENDGDTAELPEEPDYMELYGVPKCSLQGKTPCYDPESDLVWSSISSAELTHNNALIYCYNLEEGGFKDWHLPTIDELRTLVRKCSELEPGGACQVTEECIETEGDCYTSERCYYDNSCRKKDEIFSKLYDTDELWSQTPNPGSSNTFWTLLFDMPGIYYNSAFATLKVRCARNVHSSGEAEEAKTQTVSCEGLPENAEWNTVSSITQTWNGAYWTPAQQGVFNEEATTEECRFKCKENTFRRVWINDYNKIERCLWDCSKTKDALCSYPGTDIFYDNDSGLYWASLTDGKVYNQNTEESAWTNAANYCENLVEGGFDDWRLPTIDELRTLIQNCPDTEPGGACDLEQEDHSSCYHTCDIDGEFSGKYSKLGDIRIELWSSSITYTDPYPPTTRSFWVVDFAYASIWGGYENNEEDIRCVRKDEIPTEGE